MKKFFVVTLLMVSPAAIAQTGPFTIKIRFGQVDTTCYPSCEHPSEWVVRLDADIFDSQHNYVPPSNSYYYNWGADFCLGGGLQYGWAVGYGRSYVTPDGLKSKNYDGCCTPCQYQTYFVRVKVTIGGDDYESTIVRVPDEGQDVIIIKEQVTLNQKRESGLSVGNVGRKLGSVIYNFPSPFLFYIPSGNSEIFRGSQQLVSSPFEKYNRWQGVSDIVNHRQFTIGQGVQQYVSQFKTVHDATIQAQLLEGGNLGGSIDFKDPWLPDDNSNPLGPRNRGINAVFYSVSYSLNNIGISSVYKGVFLNQSGPPQWNPPYYSVGAPSSQTIGWYESYFQNWTGTNVVFRSPTKDTSAVVFQQPGATATAQYKAHLGSSTSTATAPNNQRKVVKRGITYHLVYQSAGNIWYTSSTDDGGTWSPEQMVSADGEGTQRLNPAIDVDNWNNPYVAYEIIADATHRALAMKQKGNNTWQWINPNTVIRYQIPEGSYVTLKVYDLLGQEVATLVDETKTAGYHEAKLDALALASGVYFYRMVAGEYTSVKKLVVMK